MCIHINKKILFNNLENISKKFNTFPALVLKSDAYGLGIKNICPLILEAYDYLINKFNFNSKLQIFVKDIKEAIKVRKIHNKFIKKNNINNKSENLNIIVFSSLEKIQIPIYKKYNIISIINHVDELNKFQDFFKTHPTLLHIDIGINRTGIRYDYVKNHLPLLKSLNLVGIMSHLHASHNIIHDNINYIEQKRFQEIIKEFPTINNITLASSNILDYPNEFMFSQPRIGKSIYGLTHKNYDFIQEIITFKLKICQVNKVLKGETVGYNSYKILEDSYIGVFNVGYSHGVSLNFVNNMYVKYKDNLYKIISIAMEYMMVDFKNVHIKKNEEVLLFPNGFIKDMLIHNYYLEQLIRFNNMPKRIIKN